MLPAEIKSDVPTQNKQFKRNCHVEQYYKQTNKNNKEGKKKISW